MALFPKDRNLAESLESLELEVRASDFQLKGEDLSMRLDNFLVHHLSWRSRSSIQRLIKDGYVLVAGSRPESAPPGHRSRTAHRPPPLLPPTEAPTVERRPGRRLLDHARVVVVIPEELRIETDPDSAGPIDVLFEDEHLLVVDKPAGLVVHPSGRHLADTLIQRMHAHYARLAVGNAGAAHVPVKLCHRLDRETSGLVLAAKNARSHTALATAFEDREVEKRYLAVVHGVPEPPTGQVDMDLGSSHASEVRLKIAVLTGGWPSQTSYELQGQSVLPDGRPVALLACVPHTGRQHQIRVHLAAIGHPLVGDKLYGFDESIFVRAANDELTAADQAELVLPRHALHNELLAFRHPVSGKRIEVRAPLPADMAELLRADASGEVGLDRPG